LRWSWAYKEHYAPIEGIKALQFGIAFHEAMQAFYEPSRWFTTTPQEKYDVALCVLQTCISEQRLEFLEQTGQLNMVSPAMGDDYKERVELAKRMLHHYAFKIHPVHDTWFKPIRVEIPFRVPLYDPHDLTEVIYCDNSPHCGQEHPNPSPLTLDGRVDMIVEDLVNGGMLAWDHKSAKDLMQNDNYLQWDDQVGSYVAALSLMLKLDIKGFVYSEIRKAAPSPPSKLTKKYKGKLFSTDKRSLTEYDMALRTFQMEDPVGYSMGVYDEYLEHLQSNEAPRYFKRVTVFQSPQKLANIMRICSNEALDMVNPRTRIYPEPARTICNWCDFRVPCLGKLEGEDYQYTLNSLYIKGE